jgi:multidrug efflux system outer membrane protein
MKSNLFGMVGTWSALAFLLLMGGCSLAPQYRKPDLSLPDHFKEERSSSDSARAPADSGYGAWQPARPSEHIERGEWWKIFHDSRLDDFEQQALDNNPGLQAAVARVKESRAILQKERSALFPDVSAGFGPSREKLSAVSQLRPDGV